MSEEKGGEEVAVTRSELFSKSFSCADDVTGFLEEWKISTISVAMFLSTQMGC